MKKFLTAFSAILLASQIVHAETASPNKPEVEMIDGKPDKPYSIISPISADKDSVEKAYAKLKDKAVKLHADAVIEIECEAGQKVRTGLLQLKTMGSSSVCQGTAIKWNTTPNALSTAH